MTYVERSVVLQTLDHLWREHIVNLDHLRSVVGFRGYAQRDPLQEYKGEAFELFQAMLGNLRQAVTAQLMRVELVRQAAEAPPPEAPDMFGSHIDGTTGENDFEGGETALLVRQEPVAIVAPEDRDPEQPGDLGQGRPQRGLPLRLRQEIQALPRGVCVRRLAAEMLKKIRDAIGRNRVVGRAKFLRDRLFYRYFRAQGAARAREFAKNLRSSGSSRLCFTIAFNTPWVIDALTKAWQVHPTGMLLVVIDNSSDEAARKSIEDICRHRGVPYFSLPRNRERHWSRSHGTAVNWVFDNIVRKVRPELFGFIDHDCFPITPFDMPGRMQGKKVFGLKFGPTENFRYKASRMIANGVFGEGSASSGSPPSRMSPWTSRLEWNWGSIQEAETGCRSTRISLKKTLRPSR